VIDPPASRNDGGIPFFHGDAALSGSKNVIDAVRRAAADAKWLGLTVEIHGAHGYLIDQFSGRVPMCEPTDMVV
jgi:2,4-dienoyl-CoA reductase-like NADH-dependent reductase (Old Yellow Enzyme family)